MTIVEFDHLISKPKIGEEEDFKDYVNYNSKLEYIALADPYIRTIEQGSVIQLERKGFYRVDESYGLNKSIVLFAIPDGKQLKK